MLLATYYRSIFRQFMDCGKNQTLIVKTVLFLVGMRLFLVHKDFSVAEKVQQEVTSWFLICN
jgi:hypothetical protein